MKYALILSLFFLAHVSHANDLIVCQAKCIVENRSLIGSSSTLKLLPAYGDNATNIMAQLQSACEEKAQKYGAKYATLRVTQVGVYEDATPENSCDTADHNYSE